MLILEHPIRVYFSPEASKLLQKY